MKTFLLLSAIAALLAVPNHEHGQDQRNVPELKVYRLSELSQRLPESERPDWKNVALDQTLPVLLKALDQHEFNRMNVWPDVDLIMLDGTDAEQEATKKVVEALRRTPVTSLGGGAAPEDVNQAIEHIKHELTHLQHALQEHK